MARNLVHGWHFSGAWRHSNVCVPGMCPSSKSSDLLPHITRSAQAQRSRVVGQRGQGREISREGCGGGKAADGAQVVSFVFFNLLTI